MAKILCVCSKKILHNHPGIECKVINTLRSCPDRDVFICPQDVIIEAWGQPAFWGYYCQVQVLLNGHSHCNCDRAIRTETIQLFCKHPPDWCFPLPAHIADSWIDFINSDGKLFGSDHDHIAWITSEPRHAQSNFDRIVVLA